MTWLTDNLGEFGVGAIALALLSWLLNRRRNRADTSKSESESDKLSAESAQIIANTAVMLVEPLSVRLGSLEQRVRTLEDENERKTKLLDSAIRFIRELLGWIEHHAPGFPPPPIPPDLESEVQS
ncbi:hypothetical protein ABH922_002978 [Rhodococcus sp. 27YEA15]|uniref:hypothetical protein n=1 Tax=Rhodococcus sp. 27YEA15 TaxID=3156259 RepID=UPI003C79AB02